MVVAARLAWLASQAADGREMRVVITSQGLTSKVRVIVSSRSSCTTFFGHFGGAVFSAISGFAVYGC